MRAHTKKEINKKKKMINKRWTNGAVAIERKKNVVINQQRSTYVTSRL